MLTLFMEWAHSDLHHNDPFVPSFSDLLFLTSLPYPFQMVEGGKNKIKGEQATNCMNISKYVMEDGLYFIFRHILWIILQNLHYL